MSWQANFTPRETALLERFESIYDTVRSPVLTAIERRVCGCDYGGNSWTNRDQADLMAKQLGLGRGVRLLELGAGSGWPGLYWTETTGCEAVLVDIPLNGLRIAVERATADGLAGNVSTVAADASRLPFGAAAFDAIGHSDLLCCLDRKGPVLEACRQVIRSGGRMAFTVITVAPGLSGEAYRRAVANGPDFIESDVYYPELLSRTGWVISGHADITAAYAASCRRQIEADEVHEAGLVALLGPGAFAERLAGWRARLAVLDDGLLRREAFVVTPQPD